MRRTLSFPLAAPVLAALVAAPAFAGWGSLLKSAGKGAASHADDVGRAATHVPGALPGHADDVGRAASHVDTGAAAAHADDGSTGGKAADLAVEVGGAAVEVGAAASDGAPKQAPTRADEETAEHEKHAGRMLRLDEIERVARALDDGALIAQVARIREKETARHATRLTTLRHGPRKVGGR